MRMIPDRQVHLLKNGRGANFSFYFSRMTLWHENKGELKGDIVTLGDEGQKLFSSANKTLEKIHERQSAILKDVAGRGGMVWEFRTKLLSPYVSGLGSGHPTETGMILDRNSGLPYIPASSVKGVLRLAHALDIAARQPEAMKEVEGQLTIPDDHPGLRRYFGYIDTGQKDSVRGQIVFLDVFPITPPTLKPDIMNPHFSEYYSGKKWPLEIESPIPVKFLAVKQGIEFVFRCFASPLLAGEGESNDSVTRAFNEDDYKAIINMFTRSFRQLGFGGKTSIGYGRFTDPTEIRTRDVFKALAKEDAEKKKQEKEGLRRLEEEKKYPWRKELPLLNAVTRWRDLVEVVQSKTLSQYMSEFEVGQCLKTTAERIWQTHQQWNEENDQQVQEWLTPCGIVWENKAQPLSPDEKEQLQRIEEIQDWHQYTNAGVVIVSLHKAAAKKLEELFCSDKFNCNKKKSWKKNPAKEKAWKELRAHLKKLG